MVKQICHTCFSKGLRNSVDRVVGEFRVLIEQFISKRMCIKEFADQCRELSPHGVPLEALFDIHMVDEQRAAMLGVGLLWGKRSCSSSWDIANVRNQYQK